MGTLYIDRKDTVIKLDGNALAFYANGEKEGSVPLKPLKRIIVTGGSIMLETSVLHRLADEEISVLFLSGKRQRFCGMLHGRLHNNGLLRVRQYEKSLRKDFSQEIAGGIVKRKVNAQKRFLEDVIERRPDLRFPLTNAAEVLTNVLAKIELENPVLESLRGLEGGASASYFKAYITMFPDSLEFTGRNRRPPEDPVNAMLSLCYTLLHYEILREIEVTGLDPVIGFYHQFEYGRESLACDLVEPYRSCVDRFIWEIFRERVFTSRDFAEGDERPGCYLKKESRKRFYPMYEEWARGMRPEWVEEVRSIARRIMDGQDAVYQSDKQA